MDVSEVVHRVALAYWPLIIGLSLLGAMAGGALHVTDSPVYTSDVRFVLDAPIAGFRPSSDPSVSAATLSGLYSERASLAQERLTLQSEVNSITESLAMRPQAGIIEPAVAAAQPDPSRAPIDVALGILGGLVVGLMLASLLAALRPRIKGAHQ